MHEQPGTPWVDARSDGAKVEDYGYPHTSSMKATVRWSSHFSLFALDCAFFVCQSLWCAMATPWITRSRLSIVSDECLSSGRILQKRRTSIQKSVHTVRCVAFNSSARSVISGEPGCPTALGYESSREMDARLPVAL